jgi:hypothetical protein
MSTPPSASIWETACNGATYTSVSGRRRRWRAASDSAERAPEAAVLDRGHEVEEHERRERLHTSGSAGRAHVRRMCAERTMVCSRRDMWASPRA